MHHRLSVAAFAPAIVLVACSGTASSPVSQEVQVSLDIAVVGVDDRGLDPSVVVLTDALGGECSGVLIASDVVLTARTCVESTPAPVSCGPDGGVAPASADPSSIRVTLGPAGEGTPWATSAIAVLTSDAPDACGADLAVVVLRADVPGVVPSLVSEVGAAAGSFVRTVGVGWTTPGAPAGVLLREHLPVLAVSGSELAVSEATCVTSAGSVAFDETTGEVVGILSEWGSLCQATNEFDVFTRTDAFYGLVAQALAWSPSLVAEAPDGGARLVDAGKKRDAGRAKKPLTDVGATCSSGSDCGTGLCVTAEGSQYCSETCSLADHCPTDFKCVFAVNGASVCIES
jgi:hypothetical protein